MVVRHALICMSVVLTVASAVTVGHVSESIGRVCWPVVSEQSTVDVVLARSGYVRLRISSPVFLIEPRSRRGERLSLEGGQGEIGGVPG